MSVDITTKGGLFRGKISAGFTRLRSSVSSATKEANEDIAQDAYNRVQARLGSVLQNPTGYYQSRITTDVSSGSLEISDGGVRYGPWLEGTSSRNDTTRFKGYRTFQIVRQEMQRDAPKKANNVIGRMLGKFR
jgi:hypothetical protein